MRSWNHMGNSPVDLPFFYFQRTMPDGMLEVRSPGGYATFVSPHDVCDIVRGEPITVMAMPEAEFVKRVDLTPLERNVPPPATSYSEAHVLYASKDRWGRPDFFVWFVDPALNTTGRPWRAMMGDTERKRIAGSARRTKMPVMTDTRGANHSADGGCEREADYNRSVARRFISAALTGNEAGKAALTTAGVKRLKMAELNRISPLPVSID